ncbi:MAG: 2-hydroxyacyl-CoA dehydratase family protein, partial [Chloroflexota bacterium]|nr:2-hydroxyacyl-CoA dehydratase family protein [Chloroflexota bacterium]
MAILDQFTEVLETPYQRAQAWKESHGTKLLGCAPMHLPEEMVHAAGATPVVLQPGHEPITLGHSYFYSFFCGYVRGTMDLFLKGSFNFVDGVAFPDTCLQMRGLCSILRDKWQPYLEFMQLPADVRKPDALPVTLRALRVFQKSLEEWTGRRIAAKDFRESILLYNESRSLMRQFYHLCRERPGLLRPREIQAVALSSLLWPKEEQKALLRSLLKELEGHRPSVQDKTRLFLSGHLCHAPQAEVLDLVDKAGGVVVNDDLYAGFRSIASDVAVDGKPLEALGRRYLANFPP